MKISQLQNGLKFSGKLLVRSSSIRPTVKGRPFLSIVLSDGTEDINGNLWNYDSDKVFFENDIVWVEGGVTVYNGKLQLALDSIMESTAEPGEFLPQAPVEAAHSWYCIQQLISGISNPVLKELTEHIYSKYEKELAVCPAATGMHHAYVCGLAHHTCEVIDFGQSIARAFDISTVDLVTAGAALHDIGKIHVYDCSGTSIAYTLMGTQQEHIVVGLAMIDEAIRELKLPPETRDLTDILKHIVAAHHGCLEYGSPVLPACLAAYIVNIADGISANTHMLLKAKVGPDGMTEKIFALGNKPKMSQSLVDKAMLRSTRPLVICTNCGNKWYQSLDEVQRCVQCGTIN